MMKLPVLVLDVTKVIELDCRNANYIPYSSLSYFKVNTVNR